MRLCSGQIVLVKEYCTIYAIAAAIGSIPSYYKVEPITTGEKLVVVEVGSQHVTFLDTAGKQFLLLTQS